MARASLLGVMQAAAQTLRLPALAASIQHELSSSSNNGRSGAGAAQPAAAAAAPQLAGQAQTPGQLQQQPQQQAQQPQQQPRRAVCPKSPSEAGSQCYATPPGSIAGGEESGSDAEEEYQDGGSSSGGSGCSNPRVASPQPASSSGSAGEITARRDSLTGGAVGEAVVQQLEPPLPQLRLGGVDQLAAGGSAPGSARGPPSSRIPGVSLVSPLPAAAAKPAAAGAVPGPGGAARSGRVSPQVLLRLQSISSKLEAALADQALDVDGA